MNPLILDTDGGVDDAQALLMLLTNGRPPVAITTVFGNVPLAQATANILAVLAVAGADIPVHAGSAVPLVQPAVHATHIHGDDGLGGVARPETTAKAHDDDAVTVLRRAAHEAADAGGSVDLLMIGPLTNLALALRIDPDMVRGLGRVTIMGATVYGRGNSTPAAEFNIFADPEAAAIVFQTALDITLIPWEPCMSHVMTGADLDREIATQPAGPLHDFGKGLAVHSRRTTQSYGGPDVMRYVDTLAAAVCLDDTITTQTLTASIDVALAPGITRGMTVVDPSGRLGTPPVRIVEAVEHGPLHKAYLRSFQPV